MIKNSDENIYEIIFDEVLSHYFENVIEYNLIFSIEEMLINDFINKYKWLIKKNLNYGFPATLVFSNIEDLKDYLEEKRFKVYKIISSMGLHGFIISKKVTTLEG